MCEELCRGASSEYVGVPLLPHKFHREFVPSWSSPLSFVLSWNVMKGDRIIPTKFILAYKSRHLGLNIKIILYL